MLSQSTSAPLVAVVGATGAQGGSVIKELIASDKPYRIRGLTRDANKPAAQKLTEQGVEMVSISLHVENKADTTRAFSGATYVFAVTQFWEHLDKDREVAEGKMMVDAALAAEVKLFIWSGLVSFTDASKGKYTHVYHFDGKADVTKYAQESGLPTTVVAAASYMSNFQTMLKPTKQADGSFVIGSPCPPDSCTHLLDAANDYGLFVRAAIESQDNAHFKPGSTVAAFSEELNWEEIAEQFSEVTGKSVKFVELSPDQYMKPFGPEKEKVARELLQMSQAIAEFGYYGPDTNLIGIHHHLPRQPRTFKEYLEANKSDWDKILA